MIFFFGLFVFLPTSISVSFILSWKMLNLKAIWDVISGCQSKVLGQLSEMSANAQKMHSFTEVYVCALAK